MKVIKKKAPVLLWFRQNLRTHDNLSLVRAIELANQRQTHLVCIFCYLPEWNYTDDYASIRLGIHRKKFLFDTLSELKQRLEKIGSSLWVHIGQPKEIISEWVEQLGITDVFTHSVPAYEEQHVEQQVKASLTGSKAQLHVSWDYHLLEQDQLPFTINNLPRVYTQFRKKVEYHCTINPPVEQVPDLQNQFDQSFNTLLQNYTIQACALAVLIQSFDELKYEQDSRAVIRFKGGESAALQHVQHYIWDTDSLSHYKETRNGSLHAHESSKCSPWLALGALSARFLWHETLRYESCRVANDSTYWLRFELLWREYFQWVSYQAGARLFKRYGLKNKSSSTPTPSHLLYSGMKHYQTKSEAFTAWKTGTTRSDFVNAHMIELNQTGFMSNRGRQNVASFLIHDLQVDWRQGAGYFESMLIDYDPSSNWGNWAYIAGVGNDPRPFRKFNIRSQAQRYDSKGVHQHRWLDYK